MFRHKQAVVCQDVWSSISLSVESNDDPCTINHYFSRTQKQSRKWTRVEEGSAEWCCVPSSTPSHITTNAAEVSLKQVSSSCTLQECSTACCFKQSLSKVRIAWAGRASVFHPHTYLPLSRNQVTSVSKLVQEVACQ